MYSLRDYGDLISDRVRTESYAQALRQTVRPGSVVLEIGTGPGIFAILACQLGARRVFAIELQEIIQLGRENAAMHCLADRIEFIEGFSTNVTLSEQADVIISDLHGALPLYGRHIPSIVDARRRFLRPGGALIPRKETLWAAVVEIPDQYKKVVGPWESNVLDIELASARRVAANDVQQVRTRPDQLLSGPELWATLNYSTIEDANVAGELSWTIGRDGTGHGIIVWFDSDLADGVSFSNAPGAPGTIYGSLLFPWEHPVQVTKGETVCVQLEARLTGDDYAWHWTTRVKGRDAAGTIREQFDQSTLAGSVLSLQLLRKLAANHIPQLSDDGLLDLRILEMMNGRATLQEIAEKMATEHPQRFVSWHDAMKVVGSLSKKYSR